MRHTLYVGALALLGSATAQAALPPPSVIPFDAAFMVNAPLDVTPLDDFSIEGAPPTLFLDLPGSSPFTFLDSKWFFGGVEQFTLTPTHAQGLDQFWMIPSDVVWSAEKALGIWRVDTRYSFGDIIFAENGGIGVGITTATGAASINFSVTPNPVPLPPAVVSFVAALALLRSRQRRA